MRVVDASVIPAVTNANINAPVMMLAEKAADDIINYYLHKPKNTHTRNDYDRYNPRVVGPKAKFSNQ